MGAAGATGLGASPTVHLNPVVPIYIIYRDQFTEGLGRTGNAHFRGPSGRKHFPADAARDVFRGMCFGRCSESFQDVVTKKRATLNFVLSTRAQGRRRLRGSTVRLKPAGLPREPRPSYSRSAAPIVSSLPCARGGRCTCHRNMACGNPGTKGGPSLDSSRITYHVVILVRIKGPAATPAAAQQGVFCASACAARTLSQSTRSGVTCGLFPNSSNWFHITRRSKAELLNARLYAAAH